MSPDRIAKPTPPGNRVHVAGHDVVVPVKPGLNVDVRAIDATVTDRTPADPLSMKAGSYGLDVRHAEVAVDAKPVEALLVAELTKKGVEGAAVAFRAPDLVDVSGAIAVGKSGRMPLKTTMRLAAEGGKLVLKPVTAEATIDGFAITARPQDRTATLSTTGDRLLELLSKDIAKVRALKDVSWQIHPRNLVEAKATLLLSRIPGQLQIEATVGPSPDGKLSLKAESARLDWRGLAISAKPQAGTAEVATTDAAVTRLLEEELDLKQVRGAALHFLPRGRFSLEAEVLEGQAWRPVTMEGRLEAKDGALRIVPEVATIKGLMGGIDAVARPEAAEAQATISQEALNRLVAPIVAKQGFEHFDLKLLAGNRFTLTGDRTDPKHPGKSTPVRIEGDLSLDGQETVKLQFRKIKYGGLSVNFGALHVKFLQALGLHLDDVLHIDLPFLKLQKDTLYFQPGKLTDRVQGTITALSTTDGALDVTTHVTTPLDTLLPFKRSDRFRSDATSISVTPQAFSGDLAGAITGIETGTGTATAHLKLTGEDLTHIVHLDEAGLDWRGNEAILDLDTLQHYAHGRIRRVTTGENALSAELDADPEQLMAYVKHLPAGLALDGAAVSVGAEALGADWHGRISGVAVEGSRLRLTVGSPTGAGPAHGVSAEVAGAVEVKGVRLEQVEASLTDKTPRTPLDPTRLGDGTIAVPKGRAVVPRALIERAIAEKLAPKAPKGVSVAYEPGGLKVAATWHGLPITGDLRLSAAAADGVGVSPENVKVGFLPIPDWIARQLVGWVSQMPVKGDRVMVDLGKLIGAQLGPVTSLKLAESGVTIALGDVRP